MQKLKIVLSDFNCVTKHADHSTFYVGNELFDYRLTIGGYSGDAGKFRFRLKDICIYIIFLLL